MSRVGGQFPFPQQAPANGDGIITLPSGGIYTFPPGNYAVQCGGQTQLQTFDPNQLAWRGLQSPDGTFNFCSVDGCNFRLVNLSGVCIGAVITNAGLGGTNGIGTIATGTAISFSAPVSGLTAATATAYPIVGGSVQAPTITQGGSGFIMPPLVICDAPPVGGIQATAIATINSSGAVATVVMQNVGAGYTATPNWYVLPQNPVYTGSPIAGVASTITPPNSYPAVGLVYPTNLPAGSVFQPNVSLSGCQLTSNPLTGSGTLTGIGILSYGGTYDGTHIPTVTISGGGLVGAAATAVMSFCVTSVTLGLGGSGYTSAPIWETSLGLVTQSLNNAILVPRAGRGVTTAGGGAVASFLIEDNGFGLQKVPLLSVLNAGSLATGQATGTVVVGGIVDTNMVQGRVQ
jgi:hypothetical protein